MRVLVVDNYDSFTFNLVQCLGQLGADPIVYRNDAITAEEASRLGPERLVISPGPGRPEQAGVTLDLLNTLARDVPTLGVCLGHQAIVVAFGGEVGPAPEPRHGKTSRITHTGEGVFLGLPNPFEATRYHSLAALCVPEELEVTAHSEDGLVMGVSHRSLPVTGVQFHPESVLTMAGPDLLANFLKQG